VFIGVHLWFPRLAALAHGPGRSLRVVKK